MIKWIVHAQGYDLDIKYTYESTKPESEAKTESEVIENADTENKTGI